MEEALAAVIAELERIAKTDYEYVGDTRDPTGICLDGYFDIQRLVQIAVEAAK